MNERNQISNNKTSSSKAANKPLINSINTNRIEEMDLKLLEINARFYEKTEELKKKLIEMEQLADFDIPMNDQAITQKDLEIEKIKQLNFFDCILDKNYYTFHNDKALTGAKYKNNDKARRFSRKKCRDLREILRFSTMEKPKKQLDQVKYQEIIEKFDKIEQELEKTEKKVKFYNIFLAFL